MMSGGELHVGGDSAYAIQLFGDSVGTMTSGTLRSSGKLVTNGVHLEDEAVFTLSGGLIQIPALDYPLPVRLDDASQFTMTGGQIVVTADFGVGVETYGTSTAVIQGGSVVQNVALSGMFFMAADQSLIRIEDGDFTVESMWSGHRALSATDDSTIELLGGSFQAASPFSISAEDNAKIRIIGRDFSMPTLGPIQALDGTIGGVLLNGDPFSFSFHRDSTASIVLVPEPGSISLTCLGLLVLGLCGYNARRSG
jgi:hypothetical protein